MDKFFFTYEGGCDPVCDTIYNFYDCTLTVPVGEYPVGTRFGTITIDAERCTMGFYPAEGETDEPVARFLILCSVGRKLEPDETIEP